MTVMHFFLITLKSAIYNAQVGDNTHIFDQTIFDQIGLFHVGGSSGHLV